MGNVPNELINNNSIENQYYFFNVSHTIGQNIRYVFQTSW